jgi:hypothetical protein
MCYFKRHCSLQVVVSAIWGSRFNSCCTQILSVLCSRTADSLLLLLLQPAAGRDRSAECWIIKFSFFIYAFSIYISKTSIYSHCFSGVLVIVAALCICKLSVQFLICAILFCFFRIKLNHFEYVASRLGVQSLPLHFFSTCLTSQ